jgi:hypothetical protein
VFGENMCVSVSVCVWGEVVPQDPFKVYDKEVNFCCMILCVTSSSEGMN